MTTTFIIYTSLIFISLGHHCMTASKYDWSNGTVDYNPCKKPSRIKAIEQKSATMFFLHGLGDCNHDWPVYIGMHVQMYMKTICPHAPLIPITLNNGTVQQAWYDKKTLNTDHIEDVEGMKKAAIYIHHLLDQEINIKGLPSERIMLGGFGQGGELALYAGLTFHKKIGAIVTLSTHVPIKKLFAKSVNPLNKDVPIFQFTSLKADPLVIHKQNLKNTNNHTYFELWEHIDIDGDLRPMGEWLAVKIPEVPLW